MSPYGLITETDWNTLKETIDLICKQFPEGIINTTEVGVRDGKTSRAIHDYLTNKGRINFHTGIDNNHDMNTEVPFPGCNLILGNSIEVYNELKDASQHFIFLDACHNYPMTIADFLVYSDKVKLFGCFAFHDTSPNIKEFTDYQGMGDKEDADMSISCRKAVDKIGLYENRFEGWELLYDEFDAKYPTGGVTVVRRNIIH